MSSKENEMSGAEDSLTRILEFIRRNPGATPADIRENVLNADIGYKGMSTNVIHALKVLKLRGAIENRGPKVPGRGPGQWYAIEGATQSLYLQRKHEVLPEIESELAFLENLLKKAEKERPPGYTHLFVAYLRRIAKE